LSVSNNTNKRLSIKIEPNDPVTSGYVKQILLPALSSSTESIPGATGTCYVNNSGDLEMYVSFYLA
jgi:hypothetical protein